MLDKILPNFTATLRYGSILHRSMKEPFLTLLYLHNTKLHPTLHYSGCTEANSTVPTQHRAYQHTTILLRHYTQLHPTKPKLDRSSAHITETGRDTATPHMTPLMPRDAIRHFRYTLPNSTRATHHSTTQWRNSSLLDCTSLDYATPYHT